MITREPAEASWLEAVVRGQGRAARGPAKDLSLDGLYLEVVNEECMACFLSEDRVTVDLHLRKPNKSYILLKIQARIVQGDGKGLTLRFGPRSLGEQRKLQALVDYMAALDGNDRDRYEDALFEEVTK